MTTTVDRRERIQFITTGRVQRDDGGFDTSDNTVVERWASVVPVQAREFEQAGRLSGQTVYLITCDALDIDPTTDDRILWGSIELNIREVRRAHAGSLHLEIKAQAGAVR